MNQVRIKCECGAEGWFTIKDEIYSTTCPTCSKTYMINKDGIVKEVKSRPTKPAKSGTPLFNKDMFFIE